MIDTRPAALVPREMHQRKPAHGKPCNRCGLCCYMTLCDLARSVFKRPEKPAMGPCPALRKHAQIPGEYECGLVVEPQLYRYGIEPKQLSDAAKTLIMAGDGCDARINGEPRDEKFVKHLDRLDAKRTEKIRRAWITWGDLDERSL